MLLAALVAASVPLHADLNPDSGAFILQKYTAKDYAANQQNWAAVQDSRGVMYFANTDGVLEFDGVTWRNIPLSIQSGVYSLAIDSRGTVFVGAQGVFGYIAPGPEGESRFVSLLDKVAAEDRSFSDVWNVLPTSDGVYFASYQRLFLYTSGGELRTFRPTKKFGHAFTFHDEFFITSDDRGLLTMQGGDLVESSIRADTSVLRGNPVFAPGAVPLIAVNKRLYRFSLGSIDPFPTAADNYFEQHRIYSVRQLSSGDIAIGTINGGLVLLNQKGQLERIVRKTDGLPSDRINAISADHSGGIWLMTDSGLARFVSTLSSYEEHQGIHGNVYSVARFGDSLYVGTALGLFKLRSVPGAEALFDAVPAVQGMVFDLEEHAGVGFAATEQGLYGISGKTVTHIRPQVVYSIGFSPRESNIVYTAGTEGIVKLRQVGNRWQMVNATDSKQVAGQDFRSVAEASDGRVWATTRNAIWRIDFSSQPAKAERFDKASGVPSGWKYADRLKGHVIFATARGLLIYSESAKRFVPDSELGTQFSDGTLAVSAVREDSRHNVWITGDGYHGYLHDKTWFGNPLLGAGLGELYALQVDDDGTCWAAGSSGLLFRYQKPSAQTPPFRILLRKTILTNQGQTIFNGDGEPPLPRLEYRNNALRFEYAAPFFENESAVDYQFRLDGSEKQWSAWTKETRKDYTNLPEGSYTFRVRAQNPHGMQTADATFKFSLMAPWYRTWWAYAIYVAGFLLAGWLILRWRLQALESRNKWLENVVEQRTAEVRTERDQNEALLLNILPKPVASELRTTGSVKPTSFEDVTVCFSDFVGFTLSSERLPPQELISSLNEYFTAFDEIIGRYGLEKLKTIGDAYMFAGGLPNATPSHAVDAVLAAMEMVEVVQKLAKPEKGVNWSIRLGLYSGPVVAGVVGVRKFAFDIWGNTVNFAARMESAGSANRVNLSETTCSRVFDFIECESRGPVRIKEGREMEMYFAVRLKPELLQGPLIEGIPAAFRDRYQQAFSKAPKSFPNLNGNHA